MVKRILLLVAIMLCSVNSNADYICKDEIIMGTSTSNSAILILNRAFSGSLLLLGPYQNGSQSVSLDKFKLVGIGQNGTSDSTHIYFDPAPASIFFKSDEKLLVSIKNKNGETTADFLGVRDSRPIFRGILNCSEVKLEGSL